MGRKCFLGLAVLFIAVGAATGSASVDGAGACSIAIDSVQDGQLGDARALVDAFDTTDPALQSCKETVEDIADERERVAEEHLDRAMDMSLSVEKRAEELDEALLLNADLADDPRVVALSPVLNPPSPDGPCETAEELLETDLDGAEDIFTQLSTASDEDLKACGELGLSKVVAARVAAQQDAGTERAERWWDDMVDDFLVPMLEIVGGVLVVALVVAALVKLLGAFSPWRRIPPFTGTLAVALAGVVAIVGNLVLELLGNVAHGMNLAVAIVLFLALVALVVLAVQTRGGRAERPLAVAAGVAGLATAVVWIQDVLSDRHTDWWNVALLGMVGIAGLVALVIAQTTRSRLVIDPVDASSKEIGTEFAWLVRERFLSVGSGPPRGLELVIGTDQADLPTDSVGEIAPNAVVGALLKVVSALTPATTYRLTGQLHEKEAADGTKVPTSLTLSLRTSFRPPTMTHIDPALFKTDEEPSDEVRTQLATAGAAWLLIELLAHSSSDPQLGGASSWQSVALQAIASQRPEERSRLALLARGVDYDDRNLAARLGRATAASRVASGDDAIAERRRAHRWAIEELELLEERGGTEELNAALRVRLAYNSSAQRLQLAELVNDAPERRELINAARDRLGWLFRQVLVSEGPFGDGGLGRFEAQESDQLPTPTYDELTKPERDEVAGLLRHIKSTVYYAWLGSEVLAQRWSSEEEITPPPPPTNEELATWNVSRTTPRAAYNLACAASHGSGAFDVAYFVGDAAKEESKSENIAIAISNTRLALKLLRVAVQDPQHRSWARNDPSLAFVRQHLPTADIENLLAEPTMEPTTPSEPETHIVLHGRAPRSTS